MSDANRVQLIYEKETTFGTAPTGDAAKTLRFTRESLAPTVGFTTSQELRSDRQVADRIRTSIGASGTIDVEFSADSFDDIYQALLLAPAAIGANIAVATADDNIEVTGGVVTLSSGNWSATPTAFSWIHISGFTGAGAVNNGYHKVLSANTTTITTFDVLTNTSSQPPITIIQLGQIINATTFSSWTIERAYLDIASTFERFLGSVWDTWALNVNADQIVTQTFGVVCQKAVSATTAFDTSPAAATATNVINAIDNIKVVFSNQVLNTDDILSFTMNINNNHRPRQKIGFLGAFSVGTGTVDVTGTLRAYFSSAALFDLFLNNTPTAMAIAVEDAAGEGYVFDVPRMKFTAGRRVGGGQNTDVIADLTWQAYRHETQVYTIKIAKKTV